MKTPILKRAQQEGGQAIVLVALLMVILIASLGLAIDGGGLFLLYRDVQNATDSAALSAAFAMCTGDNPDFAANRSARLNGFEDGVNGATVSIITPVTSAQTSNATVLASPNDFVYIEIEAEKPAYFIQVVYPGDLVVRSSTIAQCSGASNFGFPPNTALAGLKDSCSSANSDNAVRNQGTGDATIQGTVYSNQPANSGGNDCEGYSDGGASNSTIDGTICTDGTVDDDNTTTTVPVNDADGCDQGGETVGPDPLGLMPLNSSLCGPTVGDGSLQQFMNDSSGATPGTYDDWTPSGGGPSPFIVLQSGIYCVSGDISISTDIRSETGGVTIFHFANGSDTVKINGGDIMLEAIDSGDFKGLLIASDSTSTTNGHILGGNGTTETTGTVYSPYAECNLGGGGTLIVTGQYICWTTFLTGNGDKTIIYLPSATYQRPPEFGIYE